MSDPNIFISRSFDERDRDIFEHVSEFCIRVGFQPIDTECPSYQMPSEKVQDAMNQASVFLGLLTLDHNNPSANRTRSWIEGEIGWAKGAKLPLLLFVEDGVTSELADQVATHGVIKRDNLVPFWKVLVGALVKAKELVHLGGKDSTNPTDPFWFNYDEISMEISADGVLSMSRYLKLESNSPDLRLISQRKRITSSEMLAYHDSKFHIFSSDDNRKINLRVLENRLQEVMAEVSFDPPLRKSEITSFTIRHSSRGSLPLTKDDLERLLAGGGDHENIAVARQGHSIKESTKKLSFELKFPDGYAIQEYDPHVEVTLINKMGTSDSTNQENNRVREAFEVRHNRLLLEVDYPLKDHAYYFVWNPPAADRLPTFLNLGLH